MGLLGFVLILACTPTALLDFAIPKWNADTAVRIEDAYKWLYQATRGGEHAVPDRAAAKSWLGREWAGLDDPPNDEKVWEPLCPGAEIGRVNLRAFRKAGGTDDDILDAFLVSAAGYKAQQGVFSTAWSELGTRLRRKPVRALTFATWQRLDTVMKARDYPAIHHSETYTTSRRPAYRIVTKSEMQQLKQRLRTN